MRTTKNLTCQTKGSGRLYPVGNGEPPNVSRHSCDMLRTVIWNILLMLAVMREENRNMKTSEDSHKDIN